MLHLRYKAENSVKVCDQDQLATTMAKWRQALNE